MLLTIEKNDNKNETNTVKFDIENAIKYVELQKKDNVATSGSSTTTKENPE